jgi:Abnormal spindle-like microcephaly-assoc'd, ASPM-SPD-2-Hydin
MVGRHLCAGLRGRCAVIAAIFAVFACMVDRGVAAGRPERVFGGLPASELLEGVPSRVVFAGVPVGDIYTQAVRVSNVSNERLTITKIFVSSAELEISQIALPLELKAEGSATFVISFHPQKSGSKRGQVRVMTSASAVPWTLEVEATAVTRRMELTASAARLDFGELPAGNGIAKELTLTNSGSLDIAISRVEATGEDFSVSGADAVTLSPGQKIEVSLRFDPSVGGNRNGVLRVYSNAPDSPLEVALTGTAAEMSRQSVSLKWETAEGAESGYFVYRASEPGGPYAKLLTAASPNAEFTDSGLAAGRTYYYVVTSVDGNGVESGYSDEIVVSVP